MREVDQAQARGQVRCMTFEEAREGEARTENTLSNHAPVGEEGGRRGRRNANATRRHTSPREREYDVGDGGDGGSG